MKKIKYVFIAFICLTLTNCKTEEHKFPIDKRYWDVKDYDNAVRELRFGYENDEKLPTFDNPQKRIIVEKLTDEQNYKIVLADNKLGLEYRSELATKFFDEWQDMTRIYTEKNRQDEYLYGKEMLAVHHFGLGLQLQYFKLGNQLIKKKADNPNSTSTKRNLNSNISVLIDNYLIYMDLIDSEESFSKEEKSMLAKGIDEYFTRLVNLYPEANYSGMKRKAELMMKKTQSDKIKNSLDNLIELINSKKK